jgi:hypothetical protein
MVMQRNKLVSVLGLTLLGSAQLLGCAADDEQDECLPGDIDCAEAGSDGKADGADHRTDPLRMSQRLTYRLVDLPRTGGLHTPVWKPKYPAAMSGLPVAWVDASWATQDGSHNNRWQGRFVKSPLEKYDQAFHAADGCDNQPVQSCGDGMKAEWDEYYTCAGPAVTWQTTEFQGAGRMHDGIDNNGDGNVDECYGSGEADGVASWWSTNHAWAPAALLAPEPRNDVTINGVTFTPGDIKALAQNAFDSTSAVMLGGSCNATQITHDSAGSADHDCADFDAGSLHVVVTNFLGLAQLPLIQDRKVIHPLWAQPIVGYRVTKQTEVTKSKANACIGSTATSAWPNASAKKLVEVRLEVDTLMDASTSNEPQDHADYIATDSYHYILELNRTGKVIGGRHCSDSSSEQIDYLWSPTGAHRASNPHVSTEQVMELIKRSVAAD